MIEDFVQSGAWIWAGLAAVIVILLIVVWV